MENFKNFINYLGDISGDFISEAYSKEIKWDLKGDASPVTEIDKGTELLLRKEINKTFPNHGIIGEEYGKENENAEYVWVLDPIDGTNSFITKVPLFGTLVGLMKNNEPYLGMINQPILNQRMIGDNNVCLLNGSSVNVSDLKSMKDATVLCSDTRGVDRYHANKDAWRRIEDECKLLRSWGDCYGYLLVACGLAHVMIDAKLEVWDLVPIIPIVNGAKAFSSDLLGGKDYVNHGFMSASTKELLDETISLLNS